MMTTKLFLLMTSMLLFTACPSNRTTSLPDRSSVMGEVSTRQTNRDRFGAIIDNGGIPSANDFNAALNDQMTAPAATCVECGDEVVGNYRGDEAQRFRATKAIALDILQKNEVSNMEQLNFNDKATFCPKYDSLSKAGKLDFWASLVAVMGIYESGNKPNKAYAEGGHLSGITSVGILQMSYGSARQGVYQRNGCQLSSPADLKDPRKNIRCGLAAMKHLVGKDGAITRDKSRGAASYWSVLRKPYRHNGMNLGKRPQIVAQLKSVKSDCF